MADIVISLIVFLVIYYLTESNEGKKKSKQRKKQDSVANIPVPSKKTITDDGHTLPKNQDITCEGQYGHNHGETQPRYIVHTDVEKGYVILNGRKIKLKDCGNL